MIDTIRLRSPALSEAVAAHIEAQMLHRLAYRDGAEAPEYHITSDELAGSFDNRIMVRLMREELREAPAVRASAELDAVPVVDPRLLLHPDAAVVAERARVKALRQKRQQKAAKNRPVFHMMPCEPYLLLEGSVHKALIGHNITGGPANFQPAARWFVNHVAGILGVDLPYGSAWYVERVDVTECYHLPYEAVQEFIGSLNRVEYPRRKRRSYGVEALQFGGTTTGFNLYHKGPEFAVHDAKRLRLRLRPSELFELQNLANGIMRMEVSIKSKKLKADVKSKVIKALEDKARVVEVTDAYLQRVHDSEVARVIREGLKDVKTVRNEREVSARLFETYADRPALAGSLYGLWVRLSSHGEQEVRKTMTRPTFYRQRRQLVEAGVSWAGTDIVIRHSSIPVDFSMRRADPRRDVVEDPRITELLLPYRQAA
jgi:II/X family phage/plasmid replication protein